MHRVDTSTAVAVLPATDPPGTPGFFRKGNELAGHLATVPGQDWCNSVQEEILAPIFAAGLTPDKNNRSQLLAALRRLFLSTGDCVFTFKTVPDPGWILVDDGSVGGPASGATTRANNDTFDLFALFWAPPYTTICRMLNSSGSPVARGASAAADFAANRRIVIPKMLGRALAAGGTGGFESFFTANAANDQLAIDSNSSIYTGGIVRVSNAGGGLPAPLLPATDYFAIRLTPTTMQLATSRANALAGVAIDLTTAGTGTHTITMTFAERPLGSIAGEETHVQTDGELRTHNHPGSVTEEDGAHPHVARTHTSVSGGNPSDKLQSGSLGNPSADAGVIEATNSEHEHDLLISSNGGSNPMNILGPRVYGNVKMAL